jgi:phosphatidylethanolamine/phosphatidyl-N-methylethanolamine N-methyltransferase
MSGVERGSRLGEHALLFSRFLKHPRTVGAVLPSSRALARAMVAAIEPGGGERIVELGPGTGSFTEAIVERMRGAGRLLVVELDPAFAARVRARWPSIDCACASAESLETLVAERDLAPVDHVVSGLPFASLPGTMTRRILDAITRTLRRGGTFTTFQYVHAYLMPPAISFRSEMSVRMGGPPRRQLVLANLPPTWVFSWRAGQGTPVSV